MLDVWKKRYTVFVREVSKFQKTFKNSLLVLGASFHRQVPPHTSEHSSQKITISKIDISGLHANAAPPSPQTLFCRSFRSVVTPRTRRRQRTR